MSQKIALGTRLSFLKSKGVKTRFGITLKEVNQLMSENGYTDQDILDFCNAEVGPVKRKTAKDTVFDDQGKKVVVKMLRNNSVFEYQGHRFTKQSPYAVMERDEADMLIKSYDGFAVSGPKEVRGFYS